MQPQVASTVAHPVVWYGRKFIEGAGRLVVPPAGGNLFIVKNKEKNISACRQAERQCSDFVQCSVARKIVEMLLRRSSVVSCPFLHPVYQHFYYFTGFVWNNSPDNRNYLIEQNMWVKRRNIGGSSHTYTYLRLTCKRRFADRQITF